MELNEDLQRQAHRLEEARKELESFSYSVSHDLRAPLRHISGFVDLVQAQSGGQLDEKGRRYLSIISAATREMGTLIDDLLSFSRMGRAEMSRAEVDLAELTRETVARLSADARDRRVDWRIGPLPSVTADRAMLGQVLANLFGNALKYTRTRPEAVIEVACARREREWVFSVRDNGVGFDMRYAGKLFGVFQRLHNSDEFEGTGIGLANVQRIIHRHGGRTWAEGVVGQGAVFYFSLPV
jgi:light-regulated signal transduction histidine kinase (bacteriophytochrome)